MNAWDNCIAGSFNGSVYACSWYLDLVCERWDALVEDDYLSVMPLITRRYLGQNIIFMPYFINELGIFSKTPINSAKTDHFIKAIPSRFVYYRILLNKYNPIDNKKIPHIIRQRFELDLIKPYHKLAGDFVPDLRRKLNMAVALKFSFIKGLAPNDLIHFIVENKIRVDKTISNNDFRLLRTIIAGLIRYRSGELYGVYNQHNDLASAALFTWFNNHINLLFQVVAPDQQQNLPGLFLIDRFIDKYSETNTILSFDPPFESLYPSQLIDFGARESCFPEITRDQLPFYVKLISWLGDF
jgi:hypothetical protein